MHLFNISLGIFIPLHSQGRGPFPHVGAMAFISQLLNYISLFVCNGYELASCTFGHNLGSWPVMEGTSANLTCQQ